MSKKIPMAVLILVSLLVMAGCQANDPLTLEVPQESIPTIDELNALQETKEVATRTTLVYLQDNAGYLVPVSCSVPLEDGVAKQSLSLMVASEENTFMAERLGLYTVIPANTSIDIDIVDGTAKVSLSKEAKSCPDALSESNMVTAIVQAMTEYPTVKKVQILINGEQLAELPNGTNIAEALSREDLNLESVERDINLTGAQRVMLYFESESAAAMVPVTRMVFSNADLETAVVETLKGPKEGSELSTQIPKGTGLVSVRKANGTVTINLSKEFKAVLESDDGGKAAVKALVLTCSQFPDVKEVKLQVEGKAFELDAATMATSHIINAQEGVDVATVFEDE